MNRNRRSSRLLRRRIEIIDDCDIIGIVEGQVYIRSSVADVVNVYAHERLVRELDSIDAPDVRISTPQDIIIDVCAARSRDVLYLSESTIYSSKRESLITEYNAEMELQSCVYHPQRGRYLVHVGPGRIIELEPDFKHPRPVAHHTIAHPESESASILPSDYSENTYIAWFGGPITKLDAICEDKVSNLIPDIDGPLSLLMRPDHPEVVTLLCGNSISTMDMWHTSATRLTRICQTPITKFGVHLGPNILVTCAGQHMRVIDYRYGIVRRQRLADGAGRMWYVGDWLYMRNYDKLLAFAV